MDGMLYTGVFLSNLSAGMSGESGLHFKAVVSTGVWRNSGAVSILFENL
jgi:hypothetical protein